MKKIQVNVPGKEYEIRCERGILARAGAELRPLLHGGLAVIVTDSNVEPLYAATLARSLHQAGFRPAILEIPAGEESKNADTLAELWEEMMDLGMTRSDSVIALGGGVVGDLAGFAAATVLRGVSFVQIPTTLLAQVDSSVGGKVAIDLSSGKNLAGAFYQPKVVLIDPDCLMTLPDRVFYDGMAEVIKYGCIWDSAFFELLRKCGGREGVMAQIESVVLHCCDIKRKVVEEDEYDTGIRMILNFGHTFGHVYEKSGEYRIWTHGEAVAAGMVLAAEIGEFLKMTAEGTKEQIRELLQMYHLPSEIQVPLSAYAETIGKDKKARGSEISLILLREIGKAETVGMPVEKVLSLITRQ